MEDSWTEATSGPSRPSHLDNGITLSDPGSSPKRILTTLTRKHVDAVIYNLGAMLACFGAGFDVRLVRHTNVHPRLSPSPNNWLEEEEEEKRLWGSRELGSPYLTIDYEFSTVSGYAHNTYHGQTRHFRPGLTLEMGSPLRFLESPQHNPSVGSSGSSKLQSPRRKSSTASSESEHGYVSSNSGSGHPVVNILPIGDRSGPSPGTPYIEYFRQDYQPPVASTMYQDYSRSSPSHQQQQQQQQQQQDIGGGVQYYYQDYRAAGNNLPASNGVASDQPYYLERFYPDYNRPDVYHVERIYPEIIGRIQDNYHAYDNLPNAPSVNGAPVPVPRTPQRVVYGHRRTSSNVSSTSDASSSNVNPSFHVEDSDNVEMDHLTSPTLVLSSPPPPPPPPPLQQPYAMVYASSGPSNSPHHSGSHPGTPRRQNSSETSTERPLTLEYRYRHSSAPPNHHHHPHTQMVSKLKGPGIELARTSPKRLLSHNNSPVHSMVNNGTSSVNVTSNGNVQSMELNSSDENSRVRFVLNQDKTTASPVRQMSYISSPGGQRPRPRPGSSLIETKTLLDLPVEGQSQDGTVPLTAVLQRAAQKPNQQTQRAPTIHELEKEFLS